MMQRETNKPSCKQKQTDLVVTQSVREKKYQTKREEFIEMIPETVETYTHKNIKKKKKSLSVRFRYHLGGKPNRDKDESRNFYLYWSIIGHKKTYTKEKR